MQLEMILSLILGSAGIAFSFYILYTIITDKDEPAKKPM